MTNEHALDLIETAMRQDPWCPCGEPTTVVARDGLILLECRTVAEARSPVRRLVAAAFAPAHLARPIVEDPALAAAA